MLKRIASFCAIGLALSTSASAQTFANSGPITIVDGAHASPYPSLITVSGLAPGSSLLSLSMYGFSHTFQADLDIVSPTSRTSEHWY